MDPLNRDRDAIVALLDGRYGTKHEPISLYSLTGAIGCTAVRG